jgi:hypothetical protein
MAGLPQMGGHIIWWTLYIVSKPGKKHEFDVFPHDDEKTFRGPD